MVNDKNFKENEESNKKNNAKKWPVVLFTVTVSILLVAAIGLIVGYFILKSNFDYKYNEITSVPDNLGFQEVIEEKVVNIALFGLDTREKDSFSGRSDSIMIMSIDTDAKQIRLVSILRDSLVPITINEKTKYNKINSAYASGGPELAIKTLNSVFGLDISEYATVNFSGMESIIDAVGGIDVELTFEEAEYLLKADPKCGVEKKAGLHHLNGNQAVSYSRIRYVSNAMGTTNDYGRTDRQRYVLEQLFSKALTMEKSQYISLIKGLMPCCETSLSYNEILQLALKVLLHSPTLEHSRIPFTDYTMKAPTTKAGSIVYYDLNYAANIIHAFLYEGVKPENFIEKYGIEKNNWYVNGYNLPSIISVEEREQAIANEQASDVSIIETQ